MANKNQMEYFLVENHLNTLNESKSIKEKNDLIFLLILFLKQIK